MNNRASTFPQIYVLIGAAWVLISFAIMVVLKMTNNKSVQLSPGIASNNGFYLWAVLFILFVSGAVFFIWHLRKLKKKQ